MNKKIIPFVLLTLLLSIVALPLLAQDSQTVTYGGTETNTASTGALPGYFGFHRSVVMYTTQELPMDAGNLITSVAWRVSSVVSGNGANVKIYLLELNNPLTGNEIWSTLISSATLVYDGPCNVTSSGWKSFELDAPYEYNGSNLVVITDGTGCTTSGSCSRTIYYNTTDNTLAWTSYFDNTTYTWNNNSAISGIRPSSANGSTNHYKYDLRVSYVEGNVSCHAISGLAISDIETNSANVSWTASEDAASYTLQYKPSNQTWEGENVVTVSDITATSYSLDGLDANTNYDVRVVVNCSDENSAYRNKSFKTACGEITSLPFEESFDSYGTTGYQKPDCWARHNTYSSSTPYPYISSTNYSSPGSLFFYGSTSTYSIAVTPPFDQSIFLGDLTVSFRAYTTSPQNSILQIGAMTDPDSVNTFQLIQTVPLTGTSQWKLYDVDLSSYTGNAQYIAFRYQTSTSSYGFYIDNVSIDNTPSCARPTGLAVSGVTNNSISLEWTEIESVSGWIVEYDTVGFKLGTGMTATSETNSAVINDLQDNTTYQFYVYAVCSDGSNSFVSDKISARTECDPIDQPIYSENFNTYGTGSSIYPDCWKRIKSSTSSSLFVGSSYYTSSPGALYFATTSTNGYIYAIMPPFVESIDVSSLSMQFKFRPENVAYSSMTVGVMSDPDSVSTFVPVTTIDNGTATGWRDVEIDFSEYAGDGKYIAFRYQSFSSTSYNACVDDIFVSTTPQCNKPDSVKIIDYRNDLVILQWKDDEDVSSWVVEYGEPNFILGEGEEVTANENPFTLTNLDPATTYDIYVYSVCDDGSRSFVSDKVNFTTLCDPVVEVPFTENFDSLGTANYPACWRKINTNNDTYPYKTSTYHSAGSGLVFNSSNSTYSVAILPELDASVNLNEVMLSFQYRKSGMAAMFEVGIMDNPVDLSTFTTVANVYVPSSGVWDLQDVVFTEYQGDGRFIALRHQGVDYSYIDDVVLDYTPECSPVKNLTVTDISGTAALISWEAGSQGNPGEFIVEFAKDSTDMWQTVTTSNTSYFLDNLDTLTTYQVRVAANCGSVSEYETAKFKTTVVVCNNIVGSGESTSTGLPLNNYFRYNYTQQIFLANELPGNTTINGISFRYGYSSAMTEKNNVKLYLGHTDKASFATTSDYVAFDDLTLVYSGDLNCSQGWNDFIFDTPFDYNGTDNLVLVTSDSSYTYDGSSYNMFYTTSTDENLALRFYQDGSYIDPSSPSASNSYLTKYRSQVNFITECDCPKTNVVVSNVDATSAEIHWAAQGENSWIIGYKEGNGEWETEFVDSPSYQFNDVLSPATNYQFRVAAICAPGDTASYVYTTFTTECVEISIPYENGFDSVTAGSSVLPLCWTVNGIYSQSYPYISSSVSLSAPNSLYFYASNTSFVSISVPEIDNEYAMNELRARFNYYAANKTNARMIVGVMDDPLFPQTFVAIDTIIPENISEWAQYEVSFENYEGDGKYVTFRYYGAYAAYLDDFVLESIPTCDYVKNIHISNIMGGSAVVSWEHSNPESVADFTVEYSVADADSWTSQVISGDQYYAFLSGLTEKTEYDVRITTNCQNGETSQPRTSGFKTTCYAGGEIEIGDASTNTYYFPVNTWFRYTYTQQIYLAEELNGETDITGVSFNYKHTQAITNKNNVRLYIAHTNKNSFADNTDLIPFTDLTLVYTGDLNASQGWNNIEFTEPFHYNGADNIVLVALDSSNNYNSTSHQFYAHNVADNRAISYYSDSYYPNPTSSDIANYSGNKNIYKTLNDVKFLGDCDESVTCIRPNVLVSNVTSNEADIVWINGGSESAWEIEYKTADDTIWTSVGTVSQTDYHFDELNSNTQYDVRLRSVCGTNNYSFWTNVVFTTDCGELAIPYNENFEAYETTSGTIPTCWTRFSSYSNTTPSISTSYSVSPSKSLAFSASSSKYSGAVLMPLPENTDIQDVRVKFSFYMTELASNSLMVGVMEDPSDTTSFVPVEEIVNTAASTWENKIITLDNYVGEGKYIAFLYYGSSIGYIDNLVVEEVPDCDVVYNLAVTNVEGTSAYITWENPYSDAESYTVEYAEATSDEYTSTNVNVPYCMLNGLTQQTPYKVRVRINCASSESDWKSAIFTTKCDVGGDIVLGNANSTSYSFPVNNNWKYSYTQQIYLASELNGTTQLDGIAFNFSYNTAVTSKNNVKLYIGQTSKNSFSNTADVVPFSELTLVYTGNMNVSKGWNNFMFAEPFMLNGTDNIVIVAVDSSNYYPGSSYTYYKHDVDSVRAVGYYSDSQFPDPQNLNSYTGSSSTYSYVNDIKFFTPCVENIACLTPNVVVTGVAENSAKLIWPENSNSNSFEIEYRNFYDTIWTNAGITTDFEFELSSLQSNTMYVARVRANCSADNPSDWRVVEFKTSCGELTPPIVENFDTYGTSNYSFPSCWIRMNNASPYITTTNFSSPGSLLFTATPTTYSMALVGPFADEYNLGDLFVKLRYRTSNILPNVSLMLIGAVSDPTDATTFVMIDTIKAATASSWQEVELPLGKYTGDARYLAFRFAGASDVSSYIDNLNIVEMPSCIYPNNVVASEPTATSVVLSWNERGSAENWRIEYDTTGFTKGQGVVIDADSNPFEIEGLEENTTYDFYVQSVCDDDNESDWSLVKTTIRTLCYPQDELPYTENFDTYGTGYSILPDCWTRNSTYSTSYPYISTGYYVSSPASLYLYSSSSTNVIAISKQISTSYQIKDLMATFKYKAYSTNLSSAMLVVGVMEDPAQASTFTPIDTVKVNTTDWKTVEVFFDNYEGDGHYIAFKYTSNSNSSYIDDLVIDEIPSCLRPAELISTGVTNSTVTLAWEERGTAEAWEIAYGPAGFTIGGENSEIVDATSNPFEVEGLSGNTVYDFYVRAICGENEESEWNANKISVRTDCDAISEVPQSWDFESENTAGTSSYPLPGCWSRSNASSYYPYSYSYQTYAYGGNRSLYFYTSGNTAVLPLIDTEVLPLNTLQVSFYARTSSSSNNKFFIGVMTDPVDNTTFEPLDTIIINGSYDLYEIELSNYNGTAPYIALRSGTTSTVYVDDVVLDIIPDCQKPKNIKVSNVTTTSVTITWTGDSESGYTVKYREVGAETWTTTTVTTESVDLTGLTISTSYEVEITPICDGTTATGTKTFSTGHQDPVNLPYATDFSSGDDWYIDNGSCSNTWVTGTPSDTSESALFVSSDGQTAGYNIESYSVIIAEKVFNMTSSDSIHVEFDLQVGGESSYDYLKVFLAPVNVNYQSATASTTESVSSYSTYAFNFSDYVSGSSSRYYINTTNGQLNISMDVPNPDINGSAKIVFLWKNDGSVGAQPGAIIKNFSISSDSDPLPAPPTVVTNAATNLNQTSATLNGEITDEGEQTITARGFEWKAVQGGTVATIAATGTTLLSASLTGLTAATEYTFRAFATTADTTVYGQWINFTTTSEVVEPCNAPTNVTVSDFDNNSITVTWNANGANAWNVQYRAKGATTWTIGGSNITTPTYTITGLETATIYQIQVQAACNGTTSNWSEMLEQSTGIDGHLLNSINLYPNPANDYVDVRVSDNDVKVSRLEVYDVYGKLLNEVEVVNNPTRINVSSLANGMYYVRVITESGVATKNFIKK